MKKYAQKRTVRVQKMGKWGFVPKVWVALLATLISISLFVSCENTAGGGSSKSSAGGRDADAGAGGSGNRAMYTFYDADGNNVGFARIASEVKFSEIKKEADTNSVISTIQQGTDFNGWVDGDGNDVEDHHTFSKDTTFVAKSASSVLCLYTFKDKDGSPLGTTMLSGERSFGMIKSKVANVSVVESAASFLGWVVDGGTKLVKDDDKYSSKTTFVATYEKYRKIDVPDFCDSYVWYSEKDKTYVVFDDSYGRGGAYSVLNKVTNSKEARDTMLDYALLQRAVENAENKWKAANPGTLRGLNNDPDVIETKKDLAKFKEDNFANTGYNWWIVDDTTFGMLTADFDTSMYSLHLDLTGKTIVNDAEDVLYTRIN